MESTFVTSALNSEISYITIKLIEKSNNEIKHTTTATQHMSSGLFKGIINHKDENNKEHTFVLVEYKSEKNKNVISGLNIKYYDILTMQIVNDKNKVRIFATKDAEDQEEAFNIATRCLNVLRNDNKTLSNENQIIDTKLYDKVITTINKNNSTFVNGNNAESYTPAANKKPQPTFFESGEINNKDIEKMVFKLDLVIGGAYTPLLPEAKTGEEEKGSPAGRYYAGYNCFGY